MDGSTANRRARVAQTAWVIGFGIGTLSHAVDLVGGGVDTYAGYPAAIRLFWVSLTVLDPLVIALVLLRRRAGVLLGVAVMLVDIAVNWTVFATIGPRLLSGVVSQTAFAIVVLATARLLWRWCAAERDARTA